MKDNGPAIIFQNIETRKALAKQFIETVVFSQYRQLVTWQSVTGQSSQIDSGYLGQQLVSIISGVPGLGPGSRGKGDDLQDGSEVKTASTLSGTDIPRWNNQIGDARKRKAYLAVPAIYFVLFDTIKRGEPFPLRVRIWKVHPKDDPAFQKVVKAWARGSSSGNFQLHPPCWRDDNITTNESGNLKLPLMFHAQQKDIGGVDYMEVLKVDLRTGLCKLIKRR